MAELYARLQTVEDRTETVVDATRVTLQEVRGDIARLDSNQATQKKYILKQLVDVEELAKTALEKTAGVQEQVDSVRQQTRDMHQSLTSMHRHSELLTTGLQQAIERMRDLHFEMPTQFDDWLKIRLGSDGGYPSTVATDALEIQHQFNIPIPAAPPIPPLPSTQSVPRPVDAASAPDDNSQSSSGSRTSSVDLYRQFMHGSSQEEPSDLEGPTTGQSCGGEGTSRGDVEIGDQESAAPPSSLQDAQEADHPRDRLEEGEGSPDEEPPSFMPLPSSLMPLPPSSLPPPSSSMMTEVDPNDQEVPGESGRQEDVGGNATDAEMADEESLTDGGDVEMDEGPADGVASQMATPLFTSLGADSPMADAPVAGPEEIPGELGNPTATPEMEPTTASTPPPTSPPIIHATSVDPPAGLLAVDIRLSPPSSQPSLPTPSPLPNRRLLGIPGPTQSEPQDIPVGPITRSRSQSRSASRSPSAPLSGVNSPQKGRQSKPRGKQRARR